MRAWWWILITTHLVWGSPEQFKDDQGNAINLKTNQDGATERKFDPGVILNLKGFYTRKRRGSEGDEREKKQLRFHSWGGKRYGDEEEEGIGENIDKEDNIAFHEPDDEDLSTEISLNVSSHASGLETEDLGELFREAYAKRKAPSPAFYPWGGKRDAEIINDVNKRTNLYSPIFQQNLLDSNLEQTRKRYPSFSSWAGKRATAFNSWGGKRDSSEETTDYSTVQRDFNDDTENQINLTHAPFQVHNSLNSNLLESEQNLNFKDLDPDINNDDDDALRSKSEENGHQLPGESFFQEELENPNSKRAAAFNSWNGKRTSEENLAILKKLVSFNSWAGKRGAAFNSWGGKRVAAFNSWGGKRAPAFNSWGGKRAPAFNSWGGKRAPAFNSWGGKRAPAFNSWGGKRAPAFNSWGGKRAQAFNSWGGKRAPAFNSWGGKRAQAFNSWGGKRAPAFNSWGGKRASSDSNSWRGKRAAAFNSWGGKREAAFNSWGGKRDDKEKFEYPIWTINRAFNGVQFPVVNGLVKNVETQTNELLHEIDKENTKPDYIFKHNTGGNLNKMRDKIVKNICFLLLNGKQFKNVDAGQPNNLEKDNRKTLVLLGHEDSFEKRIWPSFSSWSGKRSPLFSTWYAGRVPTMLLTSGKRRPAFSSWGGKRSGDTAVDISPGSIDEDTIIQTPEEDRFEEPSLPNEKTYARKNKEMVCCSEKNVPILTVKRGKRASGNFQKNRVFTRMVLQASWPMAFQSKSHGKDFFAWGGKRSNDKGTLR